MKRILVLSILLLCSSTSILWAGEPTAFKEGNALYKEGRYDLSLEKYQSVLHSGWISSALYANMGNCFFKKKEWGQAILFYERARRLTPRDPDIAFNEDLALQMAGTPKTAASPNILKRISGFMEAWQSINETTLFLVVIYLCGLIGAGILVFIRKKINLPISLGGSLLLLLFLSILGSLYDRIENLGREGIVTAKSTAAKFEPSDQATTYFECTEGTRIIFLENESYWSKIKRLDGKIGWIPQDDAQII
jgi:tetratricopeptide (TPR) repeat protein